MEHPEQKSNVCLVNSVCVRAVYGWPHCEHTCATELLDQIKDDVFQALIASFVESSPGYLRTKLRRRFKEVFFG